jgi:hypothetical protein
LPNEVVNHPTRDRMKRDELRDLLDELVDKGRAEQDGRNWGVPDAAATTKIAVTHQ